MGEFEEETPSFQVHIVQQGDSLWKIACFYYGKPSFWREVFLANEEELKSVGTLIEGMRLIIPHLPQHQNLPT